MLIGIQKKRELVSVQSKDRRVRIIPKATHVRSGRGLETVRIDREAIE